MLLYLQIQNFAIIKNIELEFKKGMTVITGETGVGKSIVIDALGLCLGSRADINTIRHGCEKTDISATFDTTELTLAKKWLIEHDIDIAQEQVILRRVVFTEGKSRAYINSVPVGINALKELSALLINIYGQQSQQLLLKSEYQLMLLDCYLNLEPKVNKLQKLYHEWKQSKKKLQELEQQNQQQQTRYELLTYQVSELDEFAISEGEYEKLESQYKLLSNSERVINLNTQIRYLLSDASENAVLDSIAKVKKHIETLMYISEEYANIAEYLANADIQIQEACNELSYLSDRMEIDPQELTKVETRINQANTLARKHHIPTEQLYEQHQKLHLELNNIRNLTNKLEVATAQTKEIFSQLELCAEQLSNARKQGAQDFSAQVTTLINELAMPHAEFAVNIEYNINNINLDGADQISFNLRANLGQTLQPMHKVASGGELSRICLAIHSLSDRINPGNTIIFDEIDSGISGATATIVGRLLQQLAMQKQIICITHLPQVACCGGNHFSVEKQTTKDDTETQIISLNSSARIAVIAKLLAGTKITAATKANAEELLRMAAKNFQ